MLKDLTDAHIGSTNVNVSKLSDDAKTSLAWSTERITKLINDYDEGVVDIREMTNSPFINNDVQIRRPKLQYEYTKEEREELRKCAADPLYFAEHFAYAMTDDGLKVLKYRDYQQQIISTIHQNKYSILMASRQIGKCLYAYTNIYILNNKTCIIERKPMFTIYYERLKELKRLTFLDWIKWQLYKLVFYIDNKR